MSAGGGIYGFDMRLRPTCASGGALGGRGAVNQRGSRAEIDTESGQEEEEDDDDGGEGRRR